MLDDLVKVIETLKARITNHGASLRENEIRTRSALIDPLLQALGWPISDPALVTPEYDVRGRRADYALHMTNTLPAATLEAKRLGQHSEIHRGQMLSYANEAGIRYAGLTDGDVWELYEVFKAGQLEERCLLKISIATTPAHQAALKLLLLWRPNLASGQPVAASPPVLTAKVDGGSSVPAPMEDGSLPNSVELISGHVISEPPVVSLPSMTVEGWKPLSEISPKISGDSPPSAIRLPDGNELRLRKAWSASVESTAAWLWSKELLTLSNVPVKSSKKRYIVNTEPSHPAGNGFNFPKEVVGTPIWAEGNIGARAAVSNAKKLLELCGVSPSTVFLQFE